MVNRIAAPAALLTLLNLLPSATLAQTVVSLQVAPQTVEVGVGERKSLLVTAYDSRGNVVPAARFSWSSTQPGVARVESTPATPNIGYVIGVSEGVARILVQVGAISESVTVSVTGGCGIPGTGDAAQLQVVPNPVLLLLTEERVLEARFIRADGGPASCGRVSWRSLRAEVAAVDQQGHVIGITQGNGVIEANGGAGLVDRVVVQVTTDSFRFRRDLLSLSPAEDDTVVVVVPAQSFRPIANRELQWAVTPLDVALVSTNGVVTGLTEGSAELIARAFGKTARMSVVVHRPIRALSVLPRPDGGTVFIPLNGSVTFDVLMLDASDVVIEEARPSWAIEDRSVITIDQATAKVTGRKMGTTRLIARARGVKDAVWNVEVVGPNITIDRRRVGMSKGEQVSLRAAFVDDDGNRLADANDLTWTSLASDVAIVDGRGNVTGVGFGGARIVASSAWGEADTVEVFVQGQLLVAGYDTEGVPDLYTFDPDSVMVMVRITDDVATEVVARYSPDGTRIAYVSNALGGIKILVIDADGSDQRRLTHTPDSILEDWPVWTPDGSRIVYSSGSSIWIINVDGSNPRQLTSTGTWDNQPAVSPDGTMIAYQSTGRRGADIHLMSIDGQQQRPLRETSELEMAPAWFPDGQLAYLSQQGSRRNQIQIVMRVDLTTGGTPTRVTPSGISVQGYTISADGNTVAFTVQEQVNRRPMRKLFIMPLTGAAAGIPVEVPPVPPLQQFFFPAFRR
ncbi:MAG: PD40 domain-containing protein [Gemmatimonadetes bacterium]|nr:PD40 domain-containing protein [Gemmatimonadota bacterium]